MSNHEPENLKLDIEIRVEQLQELVGFLYNYLEIEKENVMKNKGKVSMGTDGFWYRDGKLMELKNEVKTNEEDFREIFRLYLEKFDKMTDKEREVFCTYLQCILKPLWVVKK